MDAQKMEDEATENPRLGKLLATFLSILTRYQIRADSCGNSDQILQHYLLSKYLLNPDQLSVEFLNISPSAGRSINSAVDCN